MGEFILLRRRAPYWITTGEFAPSLVPFLVATGEHILLRRRTLYWKTTLEVAHMREAALRWVGRWGRAVRWLEPALTSSRPGLPARVADIGCAFGFGAARLASTGAWVVGVEPDAEYVRRAAREYPGIAFVRASATCLPFRPGQVDAFTMLDVLEHVGAIGMAPVEAQVLAIKEATGALRPGGIAVVTVPASGPAAALDSLNRYENLRRHMSRWLPLDPTEVAPGSSHVHFSEGDVRLLLGGAGMTIVRASRSGTGVIAELVHLAILIATRGVGRSDSAYRWLRLLYFAVHVLDDAIPLPRFGYSLAVLACRRR